MPVRLADLGYVPIRAELSDGSTIELRFLSGRDTDFLSKLLNQDLDARAFVVAFLHRQLIEPRLTQVEVANWSDANLERAAKTFAEAQPSGFGKHMADDLDVFEGFRDIARAYHDEMYAEVRKSLNAFAGNYADQIKPFFGIPDSLAASFGAPVAFESPMYDIGFAATQVVETSMNHFALGDLGIDALLHPGSALDVFSTAMAGAFTMPSLELVNDYSSGAAAAIEAMNGEFGRSIASLVQPIDFRQLIPNLPDFTEPFRRLVQARDGATALDEAGFGYSVELWEMQFLVELSAIDSHDRPAIIVAELQSETEGQEFEDEMRNLFAPPSILANRWPAVAEGIEDHRNGRYYASVSTLLPQIEGVINDILTLTEGVTWEKGKAFRKNPDGTKGRELKGPENKIALAKRTTSINQALAKFVANWLVPERHAILHGVNPAYGQAKRSVHAVLVLVSLALVVVQLEEDIKLATQNLVT